MQTILGEVVGNPPAKDGGAPAAGGISSVSDSGLQERQKQVLKRPIGSLFRSENAKQNCHRETMPSPTEVDGGMVSRPLQ